MWSKPGYSLCKFLFCFTRQEECVFCCTLSSVYLNFTDTDTHRHIPITHTHTHTHSQAILWCDLQHMQAGIQLPPCQWPIQPSGCTSLRLSLQPPSSVYTITSSTLGAPSSIKQRSHSHHWEAHTRFDLSFTKSLTAVSNGYPRSHAESDPRMR